MKVAYYGNNLNHGYFMVSALRDRGVEAKIFLPEYPLAQDRHAWWTHESVDKRLVHPLGFGQPQRGAIRPTRWDPRVRALRRAVSDYDLLVINEDGPCLFASRAGGPPMVMHPQGADLLLLPYEVRRVGGVSGALRAGGRGLARVDLLAPLRAGETYVRARCAQARQRRGIRRCAGFMLGSGQYAEVLEALGVPPRPTLYVPFPLDPTVFAEHDEELREDLSRRYADVDLLLVHPARQFFLPLDGNPYLKDNDKLIRGFAAFVSRSQRRARLLLVEKTAREQDLAAARALVEELGISDHVEWFPQLPNTQLRAYYSLEQTVVCDQYNPNLAYMGNVGREACLYGRPLLTGWNDAWARPLYGDECRPAHVFAALSEGEVEARLHELAELSLEERLERGQAGREWFLKHHDLDRAMSRQIEFFGRILSASR